MKPYPEVPAGLVVEHDGPVLRLRIDRAERRNSLTDPIVYALVDLFDAAGSDESVRVIHLTGTGEHFCSGFDMASALVPRSSKLLSQNHDQFHPPGDAGAGSVPHHLQVVGGLLLTARC